jgi:hypothetical protein
VLTCWIFREARSAIDGPASIKIEVSDLIAGYTNCVLFALCRYREEHAKVVDEARMVPAVKLTAINAHGVLGTIIL